MNMENGAKKPTIVLSIIWLVTFALCALGSVVWNVVLYLQTGQYIPMILDTGPVSILFIVALWFLPLLIVIHCFSKRAGIKPIRIISLILMISFSVWLAMSVMFSMLALFEIAA